MPWIRRKLRGNRVFVRTDAAGAPAAGPDGRVDIAYKSAATAPLYRAAVRNLAPTGDDRDEVPRDLPIGEEAGPAPRSEAKSGGGKSARKSRRAGAGSGTASAAAAAAAAAADPDAIIIYTDGACTGNPGPAGIGAVILDRGERREISEYLGQGTNNIAELTAILRALEHVTGDDRDRPIFVHSDSSYALGLLTKGWKPKANGALVARLRGLAGAFSRLGFVKVKGHAGVPENERADELARLAVELRGSSAGG